MNKNRKIKRGLTTSLAVGMSVMMGAVPVFAAGTSSDADAVYKEETVYVNADATGTSDEVTVSNWLKNSGSVSGSLTDASTLKDIKNVKGDETFKASGDTLTWNTDGEDIYYQGTTDQDLPVSVKLTYYLDGKEISGLNKRQLTAYRRYDVGFVFQFYNLVQNLTALENVELAAQICKDPLDAATVLKQVGLEDRMANFPAQLSGGEQQRVAIARALAKNPKLLLCDEPTGALDYNTGKSVLKLLQDTCRNTGTTVIVITHNQALTAMADRVITVKSGTVEKVVLNDNIKNVEDLEW